MQTTRKKAQVQQQQSKKEPNECYATLHRHSEQTNERMSMSRKAYLLSTS